MRREICSNPRKQEQFFHFINRFLQESECWGLILSDLRLARWRVAIADLSSRLRFIPEVRVTPPDDALLRNLMRKLLTDRKLCVHESVLRFLSVRIERRFDYAYRLVEVLDRLSWRISALLLYLWLGRPCAKSLCQVRNETEKIRRRSCFEFLIEPSFWMPKAKSFCVKGLSLDFGVECAFSPIERVADQRAALGGHMHSDLVRSARFKSASNQGCSLAIACRIV